MCNCDTLLDSDSEDAWGKLGMKDDILLYHSDRSFFARLRTSELPLSETQGYDHALATLRILRQATITGDKTLQAPPPPEKEFWSDTVIAFFVVSFFIALGIIVVCCWTLKKRKDRKLQSSQASADAESADGAVAQTTKRKSTCATTLIVIVELPMLFGF